MHSLQDMSWNISDTFNSYQNILKKNLNIMTKRQMKFHIFFKLTVVTLKYFFERCTSMFPIQHIFSEKKPLLLATTYSSMLLVSLHLPVLSSYVKNVHVNITWTSFYFQDFFSNCLPAYHSKPPIHISIKHISEEALIS